MSGERLYMFSTGAFLKAYIPWSIHRCVNLQSTGYRFLNSLSDGIPDHRVSAKLGNNMVTGIRLCSLFLLKGASVRTLAGSAILSAVHPMSNKYMLIFVVLQLEKSTHVGFPS